MKHTVPCSAEALAAISCDRCGQTWTADACNEAELTSIDFIGGYDSVFGDGSQVELDLCQRCLKETLGQWLRVSDRDHEETAMARDLKAFDPARHGGEVFADAPVSLERLAAHASAAADRSSLDIDAALDAVEQSERRIEKMETVAQLKGMFGVPDQATTIEEMQCGVASADAGTRDGTDQVGNVVVGLIERDRSTRRFSGKVIGFPHFEYVGQSAIEVQSKLTRAVTSLIEQGDLVLESQFVAVVVVGSGLKGADD